MNIRTSMVAVTCTLTMACAAKGDLEPLNLTKRLPDFAAINTVNMDYDANADEFIAQGNIYLYTDASGNSHPPTFATFLLNDDINGSGALTGGTLTINGFIDGPVPMDDLLTADLTKFGAHGTGATTVFEFLGATTGGTLAAEFGPKVGVIYQPVTTSYPGNFSADFDGKNGTADTFLVPEPASMMLGALGLGCVSAVVSRRGRRTI